MRLALREVMLAFRRAPVLAILSITTIAFSLFAFGLFGLVAINIRSALREIEDRVEVRAFLVDGASDEAVEEGVCEKPELLLLRELRPTAVNTCRRLLGEPHPPLPLEAFRSLSALRTKG